MMSNERFFRNWDNADELEQRRKARIKELRDEIIRNHGSNYNPSFHDKVIEEIARSELVVEHYEFLLANNLEEDSNVGWLLKNERQQLNKNRSLLQLDIVGVRKADDAKKKDNDGDSRSAKESLKDSILKAYESGDLELPEEESEENAE